VVYKAVDMDTGVIEDMYQRLSFSQNNEHDNIELARCKSEL
jgi:hypothetical protein